MQAAFTLPVPAYQSCPEKGLLNGCSRTVNTERVWIMCTQRQQQIDLRVGRHGAAAARRAPVHVIRQQIVTRTLSHHHHLRVPAARARLVGARWRHADRRDPVLLPRRRRRYAQRGWSARRRRLPHDAAAALVVGRRRVQVDDRHRRRRTACVIVRRGGHVVRWRHQRTCRWRHRIVGRLHGSGAGTRVVRPTRAQRRLATLIARERLHSHDTSHHAVSVYSTHSVHLRAIPFPSTSLLSLPSLPSPL